MFQTREDRTLKPIGYWTLSWSEDECNYSALECEFVDVVWALQTLLVYIKYETFTVFTGHHALNMLFNITESSGSLTLWRLRLAEFDFNIKYREGGDNHHDNSLSRILTGSPTVDNDENDITEF